MHKMCLVSLIKFMINQLFLGMFYNFKLQTLWPHELTTQLDFASLMTGHLKVC